MLAVPTALLFELHLMCRGISWVGRSAAATVEIGLSENRSIVARTVMGQDEGKMREKNRAFQSLLASCSFFQNLVGFLQTLHLG